MASPTPRRGGVSLAGRANEDGRVQGVPSAGSDTAWNRTVCDDCLANGWRPYGQWDKCEHREASSRLAKKRKRYYESFEWADQMTGVPVDLVMLTFTPPGTITREDCKNEWRSGTTYHDPEDWWRCRFVGMFSDLRRTKLWRDLGMVGGIWAYECKTRQAGEYVCYHRQCRCYTNAHGKDTCACDAGLEHCENPKHYRQAEGDEWHPHLHVVARQAKTVRIETEEYGDDGEYLRVETETPGGRTASKLLTKGYTNPHGFGFVDFDDRRSTDLRWAVRYATKYVTKARRGRHRMGVWGDLYGKQAAVRTSMEAMKWLR